MVLELQPLQISQNLSDFLIKAVSLEPEELQGQVKKNIRKLICHS